MEERMLGSGQLPGRRLAAARGRGKKGPLDRTDGGLHIYTHVSLISAQIFSQMLGSFCALRLIISIEYSAVNEAM